MANPYVPLQLRIKLDENIMDLWPSVFGKNNNSTIISSDADTVELELLRGQKDETVLNRAGRDQRTLLTSDTDCLLAHWASQTSVIVLWGRLGNVRFVRLKGPVRAPLVTNLFNTHRQEIDDIHENRRAMMAILSGTLDDYVWTLRPPTPEEMTIFFVKSINKQDALPFQEQNQ